MRFRECLIVSVFYWIQMWVNRMKTNNIGIKTWLEEMKLKHRARINNQEKCCCEDCIGNESSQRKIHSSKRVNLKVKFHLKNKGMPSWSWSSNKISSCIEVCECVSVQWMMNECLREDFMISLWIQPDAPWPEVCPFWQSQSLVAGPPSQLASSALDPSFPVKIKIKTNHDMLELRSMKKKHITALNWGTLIARIETMR